MLNEGLQTDFLKFSRIKSAFLKSRKEDEAIKKTDVGEILRQTAKDLRIVEHSANMCFNSQSTKLKVTKLELVRNFREKVRNKTNTEAQFKDMLISNLKDSPWATITLIDGFPTHAHLDAEGRLGSARFKLIGKVPSDLAIFISENHANVMETNATWTWKNPLASFTIHPKEQRIHNAKKASEQDKRRF